MRIVVCGDTHIGAIMGLGKSNKTGGNTRIDDYEKTLNYIVDYAIENKIDAFIQTGDVFDSRNPEPEHLNVLNRAIKRLSMANITSIIIMGNHDYRRTGDTFTSAISSLAAQEYSNVRILLEPDVVKFSNFQNGNTNIILMPYRDRRMYPGKTAEEDSKFYEAEVKKLIEECTDGPIIVIGHNFFYQGSYHDYGGAEVLIKPESLSNCDLVIMGHYHQFKIIKKKEPITIYIGSMEKLNFGDQDVDKFFIDYDTITKKTKINKLPTRNLSELLIDMSSKEYDSFHPSLEENIRKYDLKDKILRIKILIKESLVPIVKKAEIEGLLYKMGAFYVSKIILEPIITRVVKDNSILNHSDEFEMFKAFITEQVKIEEIERTSILLEAEKIIKGN